MKRNVAPGKNDMIDFLPTMPFTFRPLGTLMTRWIRSHIFPSLAALPSSLSVYVVGHYFKLR